MRLFIKNIIFAVVQFLVVRFLFRILYLHHECCTRSYALYNHSFYCHVITLTFRSCIDTSRRIGKWSRTCAKASRSRLRCNACVYRTAYFFPFDVVAFTSVVF
ncbi:unnamed protein product, partial [Amoebophrya sp. A120]|eukprot:GSA120T00018883001.1